MLLEHCWGAVEHSGAAKGRVGTIRVARKLKVCVLLPLWSYLVIQMAALGLRLRKTPWRRAAGMVAARQSETEKLTARPALLL